MGVHTIVTDRKIAICNAIANVFPPAETVNNLCQFHILQNIMTEGQKGMGIERDDWDPFISMFKAMFKARCLYAPTEEELKSGKEELRKA